MELGEKKWRKRGGGNLSSYLMLFFCLGGMLKRAAFSCCTATFDRWDRIGIKSRPYNLPIPS